MAFVEALHPGRRDAEIFDSACGAPLALTLTLTLTLTLAPALTGP